MALLGTTNDEFSWFCGAASLPESNSDGAQYSGNVMNVTGPKSDSAPWLRHLCAVSAFSTVLHSVFLVAFSAVLVTVKCCPKISQTARPQYRQKFLGHRCRWLAIVGVLFFLTCAIGEGVLTDATRPALFPTQPYLYLPNVTALLSTFTAVFYYNMLERCHKPQLALLSLFYWILCLIGQALNTWSLTQLELSHASIVHYDLNITLITCYAVFIILDIVILRKWVSCRNSYDPAPPEETLTDNMYYIHDYVSAPSQVTLSWLTRLFQQGKKRPLERKDLGTLPEKHTSHANYRRFKDTYLKEKANVYRSKQPVSLFKVFAHFCGIKLPAVGLLKMVSILLKFVTPGAIRGIVIYAAAQNYQEDEDPTAQHFITVHEFFSNGYILLFILFIGKLAHILCMRSAQYYLTIQAVHVRIALQGMVYDKCLRLSMNGGNSEDAFAPGKLVNYITTDPANLQQMFMEFHSLAVAPITIIICMVLLYLLLGFSALLGAASFILVLPLVTLAGRGMATFQKKALRFSDNRLKYCTELLQGIKLIKMYGWEEVFTQSIESIRKRELWAILVKNVFFAMSTTIASAVPILITLISFGTYTLLSGQPLTPDVALPALSLFFIFESSLFYFPFHISDMATGIVSTRRLQAFLMSTEVSRSPSQESTNRVPCDVDDVNFQPSTEPPSTRNATKSSHSQLAADRDEGMEEGMELLKRNDGESTPGESLPRGVAVKIKQGSFSWGTNSDPVLHDINIEIPSGQLTIIVGCVGSGKSSLFSAILGEMTVQRGAVYTTNSDVAYAAQKPWIINASIRENIIMGCDLDDTRYQDVISAIALQPDLEQFPAGDMTEIGEKGINLSGGQKQRVSLARALYSNKAIVIMDDPLSALDAHVSRHIVNQGIVGLLSQEKRTAILVTNQLFYVPLADHVLVMMDGRVKFQGTPDELESKNSYVREMLPQQNDPTDDEGVVDTDGTVWTPDSGVPVNEQPDSGKDHKQKSSSIRVKATNSNRLVKDEERKRGSVSVNVYLYILRVASWLLVAWIVALVAFNGCGVGRALKLAEWSEAGLTETNATSQLGYYIAGYAAWSGAGFATYIISDTARTLAAYFATRNLFRKLLNNVIHLPLRFFDTTPTGRILNRFSSDTNSIDHYLFQNLDAVFFNLVECVFFIVLNTIIAPAFLIAVVPLTLINALLIRFFLASSREIKRLDSISRSPILACFTQTLDGLATIRAYGYQQHFMSSLLSSVNENCTMYLYLQASNLWLNIRLDILSTFMILASGIAALLASSLQGISASLVGLAIAVAARSSNLISYTARYYGELEIRMNAVERVEYYTCLPTERYQGMEPPSDWPANGSIEFNAMSARYDITLDAVLSDINLTIKPGEKVGICGRTGSGKSSLTLALIQLIDTHQGSVVIDGLNVSQVALGALRQRLAFIPQDPVLFTGTIRKNLDPKDKLTDDELWEALEIAQVKGLVSDLGGLDFQVSEGGDNFSVGQRQLFCLARAFLRKSRILVMDEATASVDLEMDKTLQQVLGAAFKDQTVLTVAHRVETIMNCDTILVMSNGKIIERGSPQQLLADPGSEFASLVQASGAVT